MSRNFAKPEVGAFALPYTRTYTLITRSHVQAATVFIYCGNRGNSDAAVVEGIPAALLL